MAVYIFAGIILGGLLFYIIFSLIECENHDQRLRKCLNEEIFFLIFITGEGKLKGDQD